MDDWTYNLCCGVAYVAVLVPLLVVTVVLPIRALHQEAQLKAKTT